MKEGKEGEEEEKENRECGNEGQEEIPRKSAGNSEGAQGKEVSAGWGRIPGNSWELWLWEGL